MNEAGPRIFISSIRGESPFDKIVKEDTTFYYLANDYYIILNYNTKPVFFLSEEWEKEQDISVSER